MEDSMGRIVRLDEDTINKIAAGEVIDRPASVVKELVENSIDAKATSITIDIKDGGKSLISVMDNGHGILRDDLPYLFERHATSKIKTIEDLLRVRTLGFRGEAMSSIVAVSDVELESQSDNDILGSRVIIKSGKIFDSKEISTSTGTIVKVKNIFYNTPARLKFLKSDRTELNYITDTVEKIALSNTHISIKYVVDDKVIFHTPGNGDLLSVIHCIFGAKTAKMMLPVSFANELLSIEGFTSKPELSKGNSTYIIFSVNNRIVKNNILKEAVKAAYKTLLMNNRYPVSILNVNIDPERIDVNVHPTKAEIKFSDSRSIFNLIYYAINQVLNKSDIQYTESFKDDDKPVMKETLFENTNFTSKNVYNPTKNDFSFNKWNNNSYKNETVYEGVKDSKPDEIITKVENSIINFHNGHIAGQLFNTYIIYETGDSFMIIDQHAAHERVLYEELMEKAKHRNIEQQPLLMPIIIELTPKERNMIEEYKDVLINLGYEFDFFGENSIAIRQVPIIRGEPASGYMISELLDTIDSQKGDLPSIYERAITQIACKSAVKAGNNLTDKEIEELISRLFSAKLPFTCPHGRPTIITMDKTELEKKFKRII
jgi:DNA mismatch repair protein MutL